MCQDLSQASRAHVLLTQPDQRTSDCETHVCVISLAPHACAAVRYPIHALGTHPHTLCDGPLLLLSCALSYPSRCVHLLPYIAKRVMNAFTLRHDCLTK